MGLVDVTAVVASVSTALALILLWRQTRDAARAAEVATALEFRREFDSRLLLRARLAALELKDSPPV